MVSRDKWVQENCPNSIFRFLCLGPNLLLGQFEWIQKNGEKAQKIKKRAPSPMPRH